MAVQVSHPSAFLGYSFGRCPHCGQKGVYLMAFPTGDHLFRCRRCGWEHLDPDYANAEVTKAFYSIGQLRVV